MKRKCLENNSQANDRYQVPGKKRNYFSLLTICAVLQLQLTGT